jgi:hypothetical protein
MNGRSVWSPPRPRLFFMHLPKTAGMALRLFLGNQYPVDRIMPANEWRELLSVDLWDLQKYSLFQGHFSCGLMDLLPADAIPIVFLREPVARTISHLKHMRRDPSFSPLGYKLAAGRSLDELVHDEFIMKLCCGFEAKAVLSNSVSARNSSPSMSSMMPTIMISAIGSAANSSSIAVEICLASCKLMSLSSAPGSRSGTSMTEPSSPRRGTAWNSGCRRIASVVSEAILGKATERNRIT